jgi:HlyD family secretion protein
MSRPTFLERSRTNAALLCPGPRFAFVLLAALAVSGCGEQEKSDYESSSKPPTVRIIHPEFRDIIRIVGQPSFVEAYERTSVYPKLTAYIDKWIVDIGDKVNKGDVLARLFVPELVEDFGTKKATVKLDEERIDLARKVVQVNDADVLAADARLEETRSILAKYQAEVDRWDTEVKRLKTEVERGVVDPQILLESTKQLKSSTAARNEANSTIKRAEAELLGAQARLAKSKVDVSVAQADLGVATSEQKRLEAWVGYLTLTAPFNGIISARNANTFDFVTPSTGDPTADRRAPDLSPSGMAAPIYVVDRTDIVRVFVDIPEQDANYVKIGSKANVLIRAYRDEPIPGTVTRTSWALNVRSRTLRAEIDLTNPVTELLPGMYAYASVIIERPGVPAVPTSAIVHVGDKTFCWIYKDGHAERTEVRTAVSDGEWIEITNLQAKKTAKADDSWTPVTGSEQVILGDLSILADGETVELESSSGGSKTTLRAPSREHRSKEAGRVALSSSP